MNPNNRHRSAYRALTTINAPLRSPIDAVTLLACLHLDNVDNRWRPHMRSFFRDVSIDIMMDMVVDGAITFEDLAKALAYWNNEEPESARWIREMASLTVAKTDGADAGSHRLGAGDRQGP